MAKDRILSFDFGARRIGIATGNTLTRTTQALTTLSARNGIPDWTSIDAMIKEWKPVKLVVGLPLTMEGIERESADAARQFGEQLADHTSIEVVFVDERLTSATADALLREAAAPGKSLTKKRQQSRDSLAAELILHTYFEENPAP